jgi:hypothetical protein
MINAASPARLAESRTEFASSRVDSYSLQPAAAPPTEMRAMLRFPNTRSGSAASRSYSAIAAPGGGVGDHLRILERGVQDVEGDGDCSKQAGRDERLVKRARVAGVQRDAIPGCHASLRQGSRQAAGPPVGFGVRDRGAVDEDQVRFVRPSLGRAGEHLIDPLHPGHGAQAGSRRVCARSSLLLVLPKNTGA